MKKTVLLLSVFAMLCASVFANGQKQAAPAAGGTAAKAAPAKGKQLYIVGIYKSGDQSWFLTEGKGAQAAVEAAGGKWQYMDTKLDGGLYNQLIDTCIANHVSGVLTCTPDQTLSEAVVNKLKAAGIPVVACDDPLIDTNGKYLAPWVGIDAYNIGVQSGKWGVQWIKDNKLADDPTFAIMYLGIPTLSSVTPRTQAQEDQVHAAFPNFPKNRQFEPAYDGTNEQATTAASAVITGHPEIKRWLVFSINDEGAQGASRSLESAGFNAKNGSMVIGFGGYLAKDEFPKPNSPFKAAVYFSATDVGKMSAKELIDYIKNGTPMKEKQAVSARVIVPSDNLKEIMPEYF
jgi:L-arabinose transport system substrate-binding protein